MMARMAEGKVTGGAGGRAAHVEPSRAPAPPLDGGPD